jgi:hypothetical protein
MKEFDFYQTVGVVAPGVLVVTGGVVLFFPDQRQALMSVANVSLGSLGLGLILAYVVGQLLQAVGNSIEVAWWSLWRGMPTDWIRTGKHDLVAKAQRDQIQQRAQAMLNDPSFDLSAVGKKHWYAVTRQIYASISAGTRASRVDIFNGNYGLCRGIAAGLLVLLLAAAIVDWQAWKLEIALGILFATAIYRMHRFGVHYGRELFVQFLVLHDSGEDLLIRRNTP